MKKRIAIHSVPRSGSTWLGSIFDSHPKVSYRYQPLFSYAFKNYLDETFTKTDVHSFFNAIAHSDDEFINQTKEKSLGIVPSFEKDEDLNTVAYKEVRYHHLLEHLLKIDDGLIVVGLIRNPLATIYSWYKAPKEFRNDLGWKFEDEWRFAEKKNQGRPEEFNGYEKWKEVASRFQLLEKKYPERFFLLTYDELLQNPQTISERLFGFCGLKVLDQTKKFLAASKKRQVDDRYSVYKTKVDDMEWKGNLPNEVEKYIADDLIGTPLEVYI